MGQIPTRREERQDERATRGGSEKDLGYCRRPYGYLDGDAAPEDICFNSSCIRGFCRIFWSLGLLSTRRGSLFRNAFINAFFKAGSASKAANSLSCAIFSISCVNAGFAMIWLWTSVIC